VGSFSTRRCKSAATPFTLHHATDRRSAAATARTASDDFDLHLGAVRFDRENLSRARAGDPDVLDASGFKARLDRLVEVANDAPGRMKQGEVHRLRRNAPAELELLPSRNVFRM
jgi:hypothetical protein